MRRTKLWALCLGIGLLGAGGCKGPRERAREHDKEAREKVGEAREEARKAGEERAKAIDEEREKVAGRETAPGAWTPAIEKSVQDKLGGDWIVERRGTLVVATRKTSKPKPPAELASKVADETAKMKDDFKGLAAMSQGSTLMLHGQAESCDDVAAAADRFARIDGIDRITIDARCTPK